MQVIVYADPEFPAPSGLHVMYAGQDTLEESAFKYLEPFGIDYVIVDSSVIPDSPFIYADQTVEIVSGVPVFGWNIGDAQQTATNYNASYWQSEYDKGILATGISNDYQLNLAIATPENERTAEQTAAVEFLVGINGLQTAVQDQIDAATTGEEIISILSALG